MESYYKDYSTQPMKKEIGGSPRKMAIVERSKLMTSDGQTLNDYDQFYRDHKILLFLFVLLGVMPIRRNNKVGKIVFQWYSSVTIYAGCFYIVTTVLVVSIGIERLDILWNTSQKFDEYIYSVIFVIFLIPHFWIPFVGWGVASEVVIYKNSWGPFQVHYYEITGKIMQFPNLEILIIIISIGCLILAIIFLLTLSILLTGFTLWHTTAYYHIITMINMNAALWYINLRAIGNATDSVAKSFEKDIEENCTDYIIARYRYLWLELNDILQRVGWAYTRTYSTYCLFMFVNITIAIYGLMSDIIDFGFTFSFKQLGLLVDCAYCSVLLFIFCDCSYQITIKISHRIQNALMTIDLTTVDKVTLREIEIFLIAIQLNPSVVSLKGYANVNRELLTSSVATISIYLTVLLQFKMSLLKDSLVSQKISKLLSNEIVF